MYGQNTYLNSTPQRYRIGPIISNGAFHYALETSPYARDPKYVQAVMRSYIEVKEARGRSKQEIAYKLEILERELPALRDSWQAIREERRLPVSRVLGGRRQQGGSQNRPAQGESWQDHLVLGRHNTHSGGGGGGGPARHPSSASTATVRPSGQQPARRSSWQQLPAAATTAPARNPEDTDEPPPPPYARQDPEPDATRSLQVRLAHEAEQEGFSNLPEAEARRRQEEEDENNNGNDRQGGEGGEGEWQQMPSGSGTATSPPAAAATQSHGTYSPPPGPPPGRDQDTTLQRESSRRSEHQPSSPPTDPEEARIWEESQLEEAVRLSRASERERLELEEAMRLSLAESERASNSNAGGGDAGPSGAAYGGFEGDSSSDTASRRVSSYNPSQELESGHQRSASDVHRQARPSNPGAGEDMKNVTGGMDHLTIPEGWGMSGTKTGSSGGSQNNLMDDDDLYGSSPSAAMGQPALAPQRTGAVMQSKNPFLSPGERNEGSTSGPGAQYGFPQQQQQQQQPGPSSPGTSRTQPLAQADKGLPSVPADSSNPSAYEPPTGPPPPAHQGASGSPAQDGPSPPPPLPARNFSSSAYAQAQETARRPLPAPQGTQPPALPRRNVSGAPAQVYTPSNPPPSSFPDHSPKPPQSPSPSFFPPSATTATASSSAGLQRASSTHHNGEDPLEMLREFHTVFLVDDSTSMAGERWEQAQSALMGVAETAARYDEAGVDIYFLNSKRVGKELHAAADLEDLFAGLQPRGATSTGVRLEAILRDYMTRLERSQITSPGVEPGQGYHVKPLNLIVVTDGVFAHPVLARKRAVAVNPALNRGQLLGVAPVDDPESVLIAWAKRLDKGEFPLSQLGVQFLQIGNDSEAREALQELDDNLASTHNIRDFVDTITFTGDEISADLVKETLLGGINRRLDRRS